MEANRHSFRKPRFSCTPTLSLESSVGRIGSELPTIWGVVPRTLAMYAMYR